MLKSEKEKKGEQDCHSFSFCAVRREYIDGQGRVERGGSHSISFNPTIGVSSRESKGKKGVEHLFSPPSRVRIEKISSTTPRKRRRKRLQGPSSSFLADPRSPKKIGEWADGGGGGLEKKGKTIIYLTRRALKRRTKGMYTKS